MKIYSHVITEADVYRTLRQAVPGAFTDERGVRSFKPRAGGNGFELFLAHAKDETHKRARNSGTNGSGYDFALTWDEYGLWFAELFKLDPAAKISWWKNARDFLEGTRRDSQRVHAPGSAPWLKDTKLASIAYPCVRTLSCALDRDNEVHHGLACLTPGA